MELIRDNYFGTYVLSYLCVTSVKNSYSYKPAIGIKIKLIHNLFELFGDCGHIGYEVLVIIKEGLQKLLMVESYHSVICQFSHDVGLSFCFLGAATWTFDPGGPNCSWCLTREPKIQDFFTTLTVVRAVKHLSLSLALMIEDLRMVEFIQLVWFGINMASTFISPMLHISASNFEGAANFMGIPHAYIFSLELPSEVDFQQITKLVEYRWHFLITATQSFNIVFTNALFDLLWQFHLEKHTILVRGTSFLASLDWSLMIFYILVFDPGKRVIADPYFMARRELPNSICGTASGFFLALGLDRIYSPHFETWMNSFGNAQMFMEVAPNHEDLSCYIASIIFHCLGLRLVNSTDVVQQQGGSWVLELEDAHLNFSAALV